jgi:hypothetical protein
VTTTPANPTLLSLVYASAATAEFTAVDLEALLRHSRTSNQADGVTGMLLYRRGRFLQLLEGPADAVRAKMTEIRRDPRHENVRVLLEEDVPARQFPEWTMGYATEDALEQVDVPGYRTTFDDLDMIPDTGNELGPIVGALRELIWWFRMNTDTVQS